MPERIFKENVRTILAGLLVGILFAGWVALLTREIRSISNQARATIPSPTATYSFNENLAPEKLIIHSINVDADVQTVGITKDGTMDVAHSYTDVGWYKYGPVPGALGNAVIEGHLDTKISPYAVFYDLNKLRPGDNVEIIDADQRVLHFKVIKAESFPYTASTAGIFGSANTSNLNLVTCDGAWIKDKKIYTDRLVVFTARVQ